MDQTDRTTADVVPEEPADEPEQEPQEKPRLEIFNLHRIPKNHSQDNSPEFPAGFPTKYFTKYFTKYTRWKPVHEKDDAADGISPKDARTYHICTSYEMRVKPGEKDTLIYELVHEGDCVASLTVHPSLSVNNPDPFVLYVFRREAARLERVSYTTLFGTEDVEVPPWERAIPARQIDSLSITFAACSLNERGYAQRFIDECEGWLVFDPECEVWLARRNGEWEPAGERLSAAQQFVADSLFAEMCVWMFEIETIRRAPQAEDRMRTKMIGELLTAYDTHLTQIHQKVSLDAMLRNSATKMLRKKIVQKEPDEDEEDTYGTKQ